jgi:hypothetical protein
MMSSSFGQQRHDSNHHHQNDQENNIVDDGDSHTSRRHARSLCNGAEFCVPFLGVQIRGKHQLRAVVQSVAFCSLILGYCVMNVVYTATTEEQTDNDYGMTGADSSHRSLQDDSTTSNSTSSVCDELKVADPAWFVLWYSIGVLYMFLALAIVCDEFFVPALEEMASTRHLNLSMDVAGK